MNIHDIANYTALDIFKAGEECFFDSSFGLLKMESGLAKLIDEMTDRHERERQLEALDDIAAVLRYHGVGSLVLEPRWIQ